MTYQFIKLSIKDKLATLTLSREPLNILNIAMMNEINEALDSLMTQNIKILLIKAKGKAFSAGVDVKEHLKDMAPQLINAFHGIFYRIDALGAISIASLQGAAIGGGCELAIYCDLVVASQTAKLGQPEIMLGVFPPIATLIFPRQIAHKKALELIITGDTITAQEALALGLINKVVTLEELENATQALIDKLMTLSTSVLKLTKQAFYQSLENKSFKNALKKIEQIYLEKLMLTYDAEEGLNAFLEKRKPIWQDR